MEEKPTLFDTHCHLFDPRIALGWKKNVENAHQAGVKKILVIESDPSRWESSRNFCKNLPGLHIACGIHPCFIDSNYLQILEKLDALAPSLDAVGETGLDKFSTNLELQILVLEAQLEFAEKHNKPVALHCRRCFPELLSALRKFPTTRLVLHSFSGSDQQVKILGRFDSYFSFGGVLTYDNAKRVHTAIKAVPLDRLVFETDSPDMAPEPNRRELNYPCNLPSVLKAASISLNTSIEELAAISYENSLRFINGN